MADLTATMKLTLDMSPEDRAALDTVKWLREMGEIKQALSVHAYIITVNGRKRLSTEEEVSFDQIVSLSLGPMDIMSPRIERYTVTYRHGPTDNPEGSLSIGKKVKVADGMAFSAVIIN